MKQKKLNLKRQKFKYEDTCYDASSFEETYEQEVQEEVEEIEEDIFHENEIEITKEIPSVEENKPKKRGPKPNKLQFYVDPKDFDVCIMAYYKTGIITDELATMISKIAHKLSYAPNFINYTYRDEMVGDAVVRMMKALIAKKYTHNKGSNPFSYFTKIAFNAFRNRIKKEKYAHDTLQKYQEEVIMYSEYNNTIKHKASCNLYEDTLHLDD